MFTEVFRVSSSLWVAELITERFLQLTLSLKLSGLSTAPTPFLGIVLGLILFDFHLKSRIGSTGVIFVVTSNHSSLSTAGLIREDERAGKPERFSVVAMESVNTAGLWGSWC